MGSQVQKKPNQNKSIDWFLYDGILVVKWLSISCLMLKNDLTCFKDFVVLTLQNLAIF